jgi:hypothetical protein
MPPCRPCQVHSDRVPKCDASCAHVPNRVHAEEVCAGPRGNVPFALSPAVAATSKKISALLSSSQRHHPHALPSSRSHQALPLMATRPTIIGSCPQDAASHLSSSSACHEPSHLAWGLLWSTRHPTPHSTAEPHWCHPTSGHHPSLSAPSLGPCRCTAPSQPSTWPTSTVGHSFYASSPHVPCATERLHADSLWQPPSGATYMSMSFAVMPRCSLARPPVPPTTSLA